MERIYWVGQKLVAFEERWREGPHWGYAAGHHEILIGIEDPVPSEIKAVDQGDVQFALHWAEPVMVLCMKFSGLGWADCPFNWHRVSEKNALPEVVDDSRHALIRVVLIDTRTGVIKGLRAVTWSPAFTMKVIECIRAQALLVEDGSFDRELDALYAKKSSAAIAAGAVIRCMGGD